MLDLLHLGVLLGVLLITVLEGSVNGYVQMLCSLLASCADRRFAV